MTQWKHKNSSSLKWELDSAFCKSKASHFIEEKFKSKREVWLNSKSILSQNLTSKINHYEAMKLQKINFNNCLNTLGYRKISEK